MFACWMPKMLTEVHKQNRVEKARVFLTVFLTKARLFFTTTLLKLVKLDVLRHPAHSYDLAPSDALLFIHLNQHLAGKRFQHVDVFFI